MRIWKQSIRRWIAWLIFSQKSYRFSRHSKLKTLIKRSFASPHIFSVLEQRHLHRTDQKQSDGSKPVPWAVTRQNLWDVTVVDNLAPSRKSADLVCIPGKAGAIAEDQKSDKHRVFLKKKIKIGHSLMRQSVYRLGRAIPTLNKNVAKILRINSAEFEASREFSTKICPF